MISPELLLHNKREGAFSMIDWYLDICKEHTVKAFPHDEDTWIDIGSEEELAKANEIVETLKGRR